MTAFVFYDLETTGTDVVYDQILQFGAILTDQDLVELDRFEIRCRLLPWVVPSPGALLVTATDVSRLEDQALPDFYAMMREISGRLERWGSATFIGYNSMLFDEPFLQRAFWQSLLPPYLTVTKGNSRFDLLPLLRATAVLRPELFDIPLRDDGTQIFRLDTLAPANGFSSHRAHDAMGDVEATLYLARKLAARLPALWEPLIRRASKGSSAALFESGAPVFLINHRGTPPMACYQRIDKGDGRHAILARLGYDWVSAGLPSTESTMMMRRELRRIALNKAPLLLTLNEAASIAGASPSAAEYAQAAFLSGDPEYCLRLTEIIEPFTGPETSNEAQVEETIFDGFPSFEDEKLMAEFHRAAPFEQLTVARKFSDPRFRRLAMRYLFVRTPDVLTARDLAQIQLGIARRRNGDAEGRQTWRSIPNAIAELEADPELAQTSEALRIRAWLADRSRLLN